MITKSKKSYEFLIILAFILFIIALIIILIWFPIAVYFTNHLQLQLTNETRAYQTWKNFHDVSIEFQLYFFNVTNSHEIVKFGAKPNLIQVGPFTYRVNQNKSQIQFHFNGTVSFREIKTWTFIQERSVYDENVKIITVNVGLAIALAFLEKSPNFRSFLIEKALASISEGYFIKRSIKELTFDGYPDLFMKLAPLFEPETSVFNGKFGYFYSKNQTDDGLYTVFTGEKDIKNLNFINRFNGQTSLNTWLSSACNSFDHSIKGALGPPSLKVFPIMKVFSSDICRTLTLKYHQTHQVIKGLKTYLFKLDPSNFQNFLENPINSGFGTKLAPLNLKNLNNSFEPGIYPSGIFDISRCKFGAPFFISQPHFLNADPYYLTMLDGLNPNSSLHDFWIEREPLTGANVYGEIKIQFNIGIYKPLRFRKYKNISSIIFPIFWENYSFIGNSELISSAKLINAIYFTFPEIIFFNLVFISTFLIALFFFQTWKPSHSCFSDNKLSKYFCPKMKDDEVQIINESLRLDSNNNLS